jgi:hypothetical protein
MYPFVTSVPGGNEFSSRPGRFTPDNVSLYPPNGRLGDHRAGLAKWKTEETYAAAGIEQQDFSIVHALFCSPTFAVVKTV